MATKKARDESLDWVKGALVVLMVIYHSLNYSPYHPLAFAYMAFLPPSFIFLAGFLLTNSYLARYDVTEWRLHQRLMIRGAKLILLFTALNLGQYLIAMGPAALGQFADNFRATYFAPGKRVAAFPILTSIGYLLLVAPLLLRIAASNRPLLPAVSFALVMACALMGWKGSLAYHVGMISAGIMGMAVGLVPLDRIAAVARQWYLVAPLYGLYRTCDYFLGEPYLVQLMGVVSGLLVLYSLALALRPRTHAGNQVVLLGRYSLLAYIIQIAILQVTVRVFGPFSTPIDVVMLMVIALAATWVVTLTIDWLRVKARFVDVTYRAAFA